MLIAEWITAAVGVIAVSGAMIRWVSRMEANTAATEELTRVLSGTATQVQNHEVRLENHEVRIQTLEKKTK
jgi:hypothetical protein